jgi:hypothetical protein
LREAPANIGERDGVLHLKRERGESPSSPFRAASTVDDLSENGNIKPALRGPLTAFDEDDCDAHGAPTDTLFTLPSIYEWGVDITVLLLSH